MGMRIDQPRHHDFAGAVKIVVFGWDTGFDAGCNLFDTSVGSDHDRHVTQYGSGFISGDDGGVGQCKWFDYRIMRQHHRRHSFMQLVELVSTVSQFCRLMVYAARPIA